MMRQEAPYPDALWIWPTPERPRVHLFALPEDVDQLFISGANRTSQR
jgi:hypothetical protein